MVQRVPAGLRIDLRDPQAQRIDVLLDRTFGLWHGEDLSGAYGVDGQGAGIAFEPGKVGLAFRFKGAGCVTVPGLQLPSAADALSAEAWVCPDKIGGRQSVFEKKGELSLRLESSGEVTGTVAGSSVRIPELRLMAEQWTHLRLTAGEGVVSLAVNGVDAGEAPLGRMPPSTASPFVIGDGFDGLIDEVVVRGRVVEESVPLPEGLRIACSGAATDPKRKGVFRVYLTGEGRLDARYHGGPVTLTLTSGKVNQTLKIGWMGTVE
jgi:hypothetical protein